MSFQCIRLTVHDRVARLTLARPDELNAVNPAMIEEVIEALAEIAALDDIKALVVAGEGRAFCAGADLTYMEGILKDREALSRYLGRFNEMLFALEELPIPVIGVVHGYALAGGLEILLACDLVVAAEDARIGDQHINFALIPGGGSTQRLPDRVGRQRALELLFTGRWLTGAEAAQAGLVLRAVPVDDLEGELEALLAGLRDKSRHALARIKKLTLEGGRTHLKEGIERETRSFVEHASTSPHPAVGIAAFKAKEQPKF